MPWVRGLGPRPPPIRKLISGRKRLLSVQRLAIRIDALRRQIAILHHGGKRWRAVLLQAKLYLAVLGQKKVQRPLETLERPNEGPHGTGSKVRGL
jgi:hypothetical protein